MTRNYCDECGRGWELSEMTNMNGNLICPTCFSRRYAVCAECGAYFRKEYRNPCNDDGDYVCPSCADEKGYGTAIYSYHGYEPQYEFLSLPEEKATRSKVLHIGTEREIDDGGEDIANAVKVTHAAGFPCNRQNGKLICSHDGSLNRGLEVISFPATLRYHLSGKGYDWAKFADTAMSLGYTGHDNGTCGLHFHVDRQYFDGAFEDPEESLVIMLENNKEWLRNFSRRQVWTYCEFYNFANKFSVDDFKNPERNRRMRRRLKWGVEFYQTHGSALNFSGHSTIEFRFFRGTLNHNTFAAALQFVDMACYATKHFRKEQVCNVDLRWFKKFATRKGYGEFLYYIKSRGMLD